MIESNGTAPVLLFRGSIIPHSACKVKGRMCQGTARQRSQAVSDQPSSNEFRLLSAEFCLLNPEPRTLNPQLYARTTFTSAAAICCTSSSEYVGNAKHVNVCDSCQRALGTSTLL